MKSIRLFFFLFTLTAVSFISYGQQHSKQGKLSADYIFTEAQTEPQFKGGLFEWTRFITKNMGVPDSCTIDDISHTMLVEFIVFKTGQVGKVKMLKGSPCMEKELIRIIEMSSGMWIPGRQNNAFVNCYKKTPLIIHIGTQ